MRRPDTARDPVLAAGCVLWRVSPPDGVLRVCLVHRPRYDDWSYPKGKLKRGESALEGAVREVLEETGYHCVPGAELPTARYLARGRPKEVRYWAAEATTGRFTPNAEVDRLAWLTPAATHNRLTRPADHAQLAAFLSRNE